MGRLDWARGSPTCNLRSVRSPPPREAGLGPTGAENHQPGLDITPLLTPASKTMNLLMGNKCLNHPPPTPTPKGQELLILTTTAKSPVVKKKKAYLKNATEKMEKTTGREEEKGEEEKEKEQRKPTKATWRTPRC